jgi:hypothetical protein
LKSSLPHETLLLTAQPLRHKDTKRQTDFPKVAFWLRRLNISKFDSRI